MRFRKRVKIVKGLYLNFSNSGISTSVGVRGASVTFGKKGTYLNTGIPGTGLSNRVRLDGSSNSSAQSVNSSDETTIQEILQSGVSNNVKVDRSKIIIENGIPTAIIQSYYGENFADYISIILNSEGEPQFFNSDGTEITDKSYTRYVKQDRGGKEFIEQLIEMRQQEINDNSQKFIDIVKLTPSLILKNDIENKLNNLKLQQYDTQEFVVSKPTESDILIQLTEEANKNINHKILFWKNKGDREQYIKNNLADRFNSKIKEWETSRAEFINNELIIKSQTDNNFLIEYNKQKHEYENYLSGDEKYVETKISEIINQLTAPVEINLDFEYNEANGELKVDLDLPEIEDLPKDKAKVLSTGKLSIKEKTQKELNEDYVQCVCGLALFIAGTFFNISSKVETIIISGYTTRLNKSNGNPQDDYIYSVEFIRSNFSGINFKNVVALSVFKNFNHRLQILKDYTFNTITPL